jgi:hypothetical protein
MQYSRRARVPEPDVVIRAFSGLGQQQQFVVCEPQHPTTGSIGADEPVVNREK